MGRRSKKAKWKAHYNSKHKILLVGEGNFSFSACLATAFGSATNMVATSLYSKRNLRKIHGSSEANLDLLKSKGCLVLHGVNVHDMNRHPILSQMKFDIIIFNFPHAGFFHPLKEDDNKVIKKHKQLVKAFFKSSREMLNEDGEVHVTHRDDHPYNQWNLEELARESGLILKEKVEFSKKTSLVTIIREVVEARVTKHFLSRIATHSNSLLKKIIISLCGLLMVKLILL